MTPRRADALTGALLFAALISCPSSLPAQDWLILQGIAEGEFWVSDSGSRLLTRNDGEPGFLGRMRLFAGIAPMRELQIVALGALEGGSAYEGEENIELEGLILRLAPSRLAVFEAGKIPSPVGAFAPRRLSPVNPLIGEPDAYPTRYPWGAQLSGSFSPVDYRVAVVNLPPVHDGYSPTPGGRARIVLGGGITPMIGARVGATFTRGAYLSAEVSGDLPPGSDWREFQQQVFALDGRLSRGYLDLHSEWSHSWFEVPTVGRVSGVAYYVEAKYTWIPRFFTAVRFQRNDYPFIRPVDSTRWIGRPTNFYAGEVGAGFRFGKRLLAKVSFQRDDWTNQLSGQAFSAQLSYQFDAIDWLAPRY